MYDPRLAPALQAARKSGVKITLVSGVFDLLHQEHRRFLKKARELGGFLVVALESDLRARQLKGEGRPIHSQQLRQTNLEKLVLADLVFILPDDFSQPQHHVQLIEFIRPDFLAVSSHTKNLERKREIVEKFGGELRIVLEHNPEISTTKILDELGVE